MLYIYDKDFPKESVSQNLRNLSQKLLRRIFVYDYEYILIWFALVKVWIMGI